MTTTKGTRAIDRLSPAVVGLILMHRPVHAEEHLVQGWDALEHATRGDRPAEHRAFARRRAACAEAVARQYMGRTPRKQAAALREAAELAAAAVEPTT